MMCFLNFYKFHNNKIIFHKGTKDSIISNFSPSYLEQKVDKISTLQRTVSRIDNNGKVQVHLFIS
jgi:hypothetical protein